MKKLIYVPAISTSSHLLQEINNFKTNWWKPYGFFHHPYLLMSAYYGLKNEKDFRKKIGFPDDGILVGDSGGFQNVSLKANLSPIEVLKWEENNCDIGIILDIPPYNLVGLAAFGKMKEFNKSLQQTYENAKKMYEEKSTKMKLYGVIQGQTYKQKIEWMKKMMEIGDFDGYALSPKPSDSLFEIASHLLIALENGIKNMHILQVSGIQERMILNYFFKEIDDGFITYDSATYMRWAAEFRIKKYGFFVNKMIRINEKLDLPFDFCDCSVCSNITIEDQKVKGARANSLMALHNLNMVLQESKVMDLLARNYGKDNREGFLNALSPLAKQVCKFIDLSLKEGCKKAHNVFDRKMIKDRESSKQTNLSSSY